MVIGQISRDENDVAAEEDLRECIRENQIALGIEVERPPESESQLVQHHVDDAKKLARQIVDILFTCRSYCDSIVDTDFRGIHYGVSGQDRWEIQFYLQGVVKAALALNKYLRGGLKNKFLLAYPQAATKSIGNVSSGSAHNLMVDLALDIVSKAWSAIRLDETGNKMPFHSAMICTFGVLVTMEEDDPQKRPVFRQRHVEGVAGVICSYPVLDKGEIYDWLEWEAEKVKPTIECTPQSVSGHDDSKSEVPDYSSDLTPSSASSPPTTTVKKKTKPNPDTLEVIRLIEKDKSNDEICSQTGKSANNIRKIRSLWVHEQYTL